MKKIKKLIEILVIIVIFIAIGITSYVTYLDLSGNNAKEYLVEKYDYSKYKLFVTNVQVYVYEKEANCSNLWLKKCTDDRNLKKIIKIKDLNTKKIYTLYEDNDGNITEK